MAVTAGLILGLGACGGLAVKEQRKGQLGAAEQQQLNSSLTLASAAADAGQPEAAKRLYTQLSRHFPSAPEPRLGLAYLALEAGDFTLAGKLFAEAVERSATPAAKADALLGSGRASLSKGDTAGAKTHFLAASKLAKDVPAEAWVANGLGVVATIEGDHAGARTRYEEALKLSPSHPMITSNLVRALAQSGAGDEARRLYADYPASYWLDGDGAELSRLLKDTDTAATASGGAVAASGRAVAASGAKVQLYSARSRDGALAAWARLSAEEKDLLGPLTHRVVKVEISKRGVFYRLRAGPLADKAAARRLCGLLKGRGRDCLVLAGKWTGGHGAGGGDRPGPAEKSPDAGTGDVPEIAASPPPAVTKESPSEAPEAGDNAAGSGAKVQLYSARARDGALAAWARLSAEEKDLLGSLTHRVVKVEISKRGVFYRLRAGPLADKAAARRLCGLLKGRGRDCLVLAGKWTGGHGAGGGDRPGPAEKSPDAGTGDVPEIAASPPPAVTKESPSEAPEAGDNAAGSGAKVQLYSARARDGALAAWARLSAEEKDLLGSLTHRVVKVEISKRGVFYRLRAGPLADKAAARRLCGLLKGRGRDCLVLAGKWTGGHGAGGGDQPGPAEKSPDAGTGDVPEIAASPPPAVTKESPSEAPEAGDNAAGSGARVQLYSARSRDGALAAWARLSAEEKDLLGSLTHRVVKVEISKRGVFYRLRAGPLADKAAARRLCGLLKGRGRDCLVLAGKWTGGHGAGGGDRPGPAEKSPDAGTGDVPEIAASPPPAVTKESPSEAPEAGDNAAGSGARVQLYSARSRDGALAAWARLSAEEKDLLGSLTHRVVKAEIPKGGVFYRLRVGPLADKAAARRLCGLLKGRGRDCFVPAEK